MRSLRSRAQLIFGTDEPVEPMRPLCAGPLTASLSAGNLRYVRWGGFEVIRAISFVLRDTNWGTHAVAISDFEFDTSEESFEVRYRASLSSGDGDFSYEARIVGTALGRLEFDVEGHSDGGFTTCRTGFVVLHPLDGVCGQAFDIWHTDGRVERGTFPRFVHPSAPATDIAGLAYAPAPGLRLGIDFVGDAFEMEDHRNWTDASFKTYVRPLSRGYPYRIAPADRLTHAVRVHLTGDPPGSKLPPERKIRLVRMDDPFLRVGVFLENPAAAMSVSAASLRPAFVLGRVDMGAADPAAALRRCADGAAILGCALELEAVIDGVNPAIELQPLAALVGAIEPNPASITIVPRRDLKSRAVDLVPAGKATAGEILAVTRSLFPGMPIGGGAPCGFAELNRNRPAVGIDFVTHATQATFHAADDLSVVETLEALPHVVASTKQIVGEIDYRIAPQRSACRRPRARACRRPIRMAAGSPWRRMILGSADCSPRHSPSALPRLPPDPVSMRLPLPRLPALLLP